MRRLLVLALATAVVIGLGGTARASHSNPPGPPQDFAVGGGRSAEDSLAVAFSAHSGPLGEDPKGHFVFGLSTPLPGGEFDRVGQVVVRLTCLRVFGNRATIGGEIEKVNRPRSEPELPILEGRGLIAFVVDNDEGLTPTQPDRLTLVSAPATPPPATGCPPPGLGIFPLEEGNIVVHDGQPARG